MVHDDRASPDASVRQFRIGGSKEQGPHERRTGFLVAGRWLFIAGLVAAIVPFGAVEEGYFYLALLFNATVLLCSAMVGWRSQEQFRLFSRICVLLILSVVYVLAQGLSLPANPLANPIWKEAARYLGPLEGAVSVSPATTVAAIPGLAMPVAVFLGALALHQSDDAALKLWRRLVVIGAAVALFGLVQHFLLHRQLATGAATNEAGSLTSIFVSRNSAAAFIALVCLMVLGLIGYEVRVLGPSLIARRFLSPLVKMDRYNLLFLRVVVLAGCVVALVLTLSRAGVATGLLCLMLALAWLTAAQIPWRRRGSRLQAMAAVLFVSALAGSLLAVRTIDRINVQGSEDGRWCTYRSAVQAIMDNPLVGTGFGTFESAFRPYRNPQCGIAGVWDKAHSSYIEAYLGLGAPFLLILAIGVGLLVAALVAGLRTRDSMRFAPITGCCVLLLMALQSILDFPLQVPGIAAYCAACLGASVSMSLARGTKSPIRRTRRS